MPEGPSIVILKAAIEHFSGKKILAATATSKGVDASELIHATVTSFKTWGKHLLICLPKRTIRIHLLMFGSYSVDEQTKKKPRLHLQFINGDLYFYACSVKILEGNVNKLYDFTGDVMNKHWDAKQARKKLKAEPDMLVVDALLNQDIFAGVGNIIKNEVLFRIRVHPQNTIGDLPPRKLTELIKEARQYSFDFLAWKKKDVLKKHWLIHTKKTCPRCNLPALKNYLGKTKRRTFYCENCQIKYD